MVANRRERGGGGGGGGAFTRGLRVQKKQRYIVSSPRIFVQN